MEIKSHIFSFRYLFSLRYFKACLQYGDRIGINVSCSHPQISSNKDLQAIANWILLWSSVAICSIGIFTSAMIGRFGDTKSRKAALLIPFSGLVLEVYWLVGSEALFAVFGGYMSIFSAFFAYATDSVCNYPPKCRSLIIAVLEGVIGFGGTVGYLCSFLLKLLGFVGLFTAFLKFLWQRKIIGTFMALIVAFAISFFTFVGSTHISFYYLKFRFGWDATLYGFLKGPTQGFAMLNVLFVYPLLRTHNFTDRTLALIGLISRALGRLWLAVAWSTSSTFLLMLFDSFTRFAASGMRAVSANIVPTKNHGSMFTLFAVVEALSNLLAAVTFHTLFPLSLDFLPQLSFYILAVVMLIPTVIL
ncbi:unnamed protein product [Acanthocheilonema viteae]|uniref:Major facilitator superfamily (MFS) profile domain-containing protein n=1 Tax=Acanthocheilonema viteae TaxID=6277 RepID=A0A498SHC2_ACAVI|nr:unnamed protein product [Acanthocheilonema viteae]